jgi:1-acyl-sn-glycerol-3-phosphate acyltransferase
MRASLLRTRLVLLHTTVATLRISVATIADVWRGTYRRETGDARLRWWSQRLIDLADLRCRVVNPHNVELGAGQPTILMCNHASLYDIPLTFVALPGSIRMLTKKELFRIPVWGRGLRAGEFISIDRHNHEQALRDLEQARRKMESGIALWIAPEGTRSRDGLLGPLKKGGFVLAIQTGARIVPIGIRGSRDVLPAGTFGKLEIGCTAEVHIGEPIDASRYTEEQRDALTEEVAQRIAELAQVERRPA